MMNIIVSYAPTAGLLFFFIVFLGIAIWALKPSNKQRLQACAEIPLKEDSHGW